MGLGQIFGMSDFSSSLPPTSGGAPQGGGEPRGGGVRRWLGGLAVALGFAKFGKWLMLLLKLKWVAGALKSVLSMAAMLGVYSALYGWRFAAGFTVQLLIHELGHVFVARRYGIPVSAPMFVPFVGALILLKERPAKARQEAWMAMGGPMAGGLVAVFLHGAGVWMDSTFLILMALIGYMLNLFNLFPVGQMDGGRTVQAITPLLWIPGYVGMVWYAFEHPSVLVFLILALGFRQFLSAFRHETEEQRVYREMSGLARFAITVAYFGTMAVLAAGYVMAEGQLAARMPVR